MFLHQEAHCPQSTCRKLLLTTINMNFGRIYVKYLRFFKQVSSFELGWLQKVISYRKSTLLP